MPASLTSEPEYAFICDCDESMRSACEGEIFYAEHNGKRYCVLHFPGDKSKFWNALYRKLDRNDLDFRGVWFPGPWPSENVQFAKDAHFNFAHFEGDVELEGARFDGDADFSRATFNGGAYFSEVTFKSVNFSGATFCDGADFVHTTFASANFHQAKFGGQGTFVRAIFEGDVDFQRVTFSQEAPYYCADFTGSTFGGRVEFGSARFISVAKFQATIFEGFVDLSNGVFGAKADFSFATFNAVSFMHSVFNSEAKFENCNFNGPTSFYATSFNGELNFKASMFIADAYFGDAIFRSHVKFAGNENNPVFTATSSLDLQFARAEKPNHLSFHTLDLRPHWFVNVDPSEFDFINVNWGNLRWQRSKRNVYRNISEEIGCLKGKKIGSPYRLFSIACRRLAINAEENHRYDEASEFRYWSMDALRRNKKQNNDPAPSNLHWLYYLVSGYGERTWRAFATLLLIWLVFAIAYMLTGHIKLVGLHRYRDYGKEFVAALNYSLQVLTFQKPDKPTGLVTPLLVTFETILGPVQAALLALAIRRKFMR